MVLVNGNYIRDTPLNISKLINTSTAELRLASSSLKNAQTDLSLATAKLSEEQLLEINPNNVQLVYKKVPGLSNMYIFSIWEAIMEIVVSAFRLSTTDIAGINMDNPSVIFIMNNCLNSILQSLRTSTTAIID